MSDTTEKKAVNLLTPKVRLSFVSAFQPRLPPNAKAGDRARYSVVGLILPLEKMDQVDQQRWKAIVEAIGKCGRESELGPEKFGIMVKESKIRLPHRTDIQSSGFPLDFKWFIRPWTYNQPGVVTEYRGPDGKPTLVTDPNLVYSGKWARLSVRPFYTNFNKTNPSIALQLQNIQIVKPPAGYNEDRLDGRMAAQDEFEASEEMDPNEALSTGGGDRSEIESLLG